MTSLEEMKGEVEGAYGELAIVDAVRQVIMVKPKTDNELEGAEIQQLRQQLEVRYIYRLNDRCEYVKYILCYTFYRLLKHTSIKQIPN